MTTATRSRKKTPPAAPPPDATFGTVTATKVVISYPNGKPAIVLEMTTDDDTPKGGSPMIRLFDDKGNDRMQIHLWDVEQYPTIRMFGGPGVVLHEGMTVKGDSTIMDASGFVLDSKHGPCIVDSQGVTAHRFNKCAPNYMRGD